MKILITNFHRGDGGGHTTYITALVMAFKEKHDITVIAPKTSRLYQTLSVFAGVRVIAHDFKGALLKTLGDVVSFRALLRRENFDVVHVNGSVDHRLCFLAVVNLGSRRPAIVFTQHNDKDMNRCRASTILAGARQLSWPVDAGQFTELMPSFSGMLFGGSFLLRSS